MLKSDGFLDCLLCASELILFNHKIMPSTPVNPYLSHHCCYAPHHPPATDGVSGTGDQGELVRVPLQPLWHCRRSGGRDRVRVLGLTPLCALRAEAHGNTRLSSCCLQPFL